MNESNADSSKNNLNNTNVITNAIEKMTERISKFKKASASVFNLDPHQYLKNILEKKETIIEDFNKMQQKVNNMKTKRDKLRNELEKTENELAKLEAKLKNKDLELQKVSEVILREDKLIANIINEIEILNSRFNINDSSVSEKESEDASDDETVSKKKSDNVLQDRTVSEAKSENDLHVGSGSGSKLDNLLQLESTVDEKIETVDNGEENESLQKIKKKKMTISKRLALPDSTDSEDDFKKPEEDHQPTIFDSPKMNAKHHSTIISDTLNSNGKRYSTNKDDSDIKRIKSADKKENSKTKKINTKSLKSNNLKKEDPVDLNDPTFKEPFKYGWKRELVTSERKKFVNYYLPGKKRYRTFGEMTEDNAIRSPLSKENFTFMRKLIPGVSSPDQTVRDSRNKNKSSV